MTLFKGVTQTFDNNGNLTSDGVRTFKYDAFNRIIQVKVGAVVLANYQYDAFNRRVLKQVDADLNGVFETTVKFLYDGFRCIEELNASDALVKEYVYGSLYMDEVILQRTGATDYYFTHDYRYSVTSLIDSNNNTTNFEYKVYGQRTVTGSGLTDVGYTGQRHDSETGLMYFKNRYFSTSMGQFVTRDPLGYVDGYSMYLGYFGNDGVDPMGLEDRTSTIVELPKPIYYEIDGWSVKDSIEINNSSDAVKSFTNINNYSEIDGDNFEKALSTGNGSTVKINFNNEGASKASISSWKRLSFLISLKLPPDAKIAWDHFMSGKGDLDAPKLSLSLIRNTPLYKKVSGEIIKMKGKIGNNWQGSSYYNLNDENEKLYFGVWKLFYREKPTVNGTHEGCDSRIQFYINDKYDFSNKTAWAERVIQILGTTIIVKIDDGVISKMVDRLGAKEYERKILWEEELLNDQLSPNKVEKYNDDADKEYRK